MSARGLAALVLAAAGLLAAAPGAAASKTEETIFQDDEFLVFSSASTAASTLDTLKALGTDRIRVTLYWNIIAPDPNSRTRPSFDATDPAAYPSGGWRRYDDIVRLAAARGIGVYFTFSPPVPLWAATPTDRAAVAHSNAPSPAEFEQFVQAVGTRYSGSYRPPSPPSSSPPSGGGGGGVPLPLASAAQDGALPRVAYWAFVNEPNEWHFLYPQWGPGGLEVAAVLYRALADAGFRGLARSGHSGDVVLIGETAPKGRDVPGPETSIKPLRFIRALYCVDRSFRPLAGARARAMQCPESNQRAAFRAQHPGLFSATGYAHHAYNLSTPPRIRTRDSEDSVSIGDLAKLSNTLRRIFATYGRGGSPPLYITEFGYQSRPPDPFGFPYAYQSAYINESEYMAYRNPRVRAFSQFLLRDSQPLRQYPPRSHQYWSTFQTGLIGLDNRAKPALSAFRLPIYLPVQRRRSPGNFTVWGGVRPAPNGTRQTVELQFRTSRRARFIRLRRVTTSNFRGYWETRVRLRRSGELRAQWRSPGGQLLYSRHAAVRVG
jgi:hypothetical protein